ncbi:MAG: hypothetical protein ACFHX7_20140 [Pseudomonadota bacterium]
MSRSTELVDESIRRRAAGDELWILAAWRASRLSPLLFGLLCGTGVAAIAASPLLISSAVTVNPAELVVSGLFFGVSIAVLTGFTPLIFPGAAADLTRLAPLINVSDAELEILQKAMVRLPRRELWFMTALGLILGLGHSMLLGQVRMPLDLYLPQIFGTVFLWVAMLWTVPPLLSNALVFSDIGRRTQPNLLDPQSLAPFGTAAIRPTVFIIGMLCAYPILALLGDLDTNNMSGIGFIASFVSMFGLFFLPLRGIRHQIQVTRKRTLQQLDAEISKLATNALENFEDTATLARLDLLAATRDRIAHVSGWPLDLAGVRRVLLYGVLPPITWAAAALVELVIDQQF